MIYRRLVQPLLRFAYNFTVQSVHLQSAHGCQGRDEDKWRSQQRVSMPSEQINAISLRRYETRVSKPKFVVNQSALVQKPS